jgi:hypothetical protein
MPAPTAWLGPMKTPASYAVSRWGARPANNRIPAIIARAGSARSGDGDDAEPAGDAPWWTPRPDGW